MCPQVCNESGSTGDDPRQVLAGWLDDYAADRCGRDDVRAIFSSVSRSSTEAPWIALALLDQYQRLDRIDTSLALELKSEVNQLVFGAPQPSAGSRLVTPAVKQHHTVQSRHAQRRDLVSKSIAIAPNPVTAASHSDRHDAVQAFEHVVTATTQVEELQQPHAEQVAAPARRILRQRYELLELISSNTTGTVYRALDRQREHLPHDARYVAVKVVSPGEASFVASPADIQQGFYRAQSLAHPNIRRVFDIDHDGDTCFTVMELLHGERLSTLLQHFNGRPIPWNYARNILCGVGAALVYAHDHGVIHGDLQPQNVMITHAGEVKVLELGFVPPYRPEPWISDEAAPATLHSETRYLRIGRTDALESLPSDDLFSFACIAYELLSGRHPYDGQSDTLAKAQGRRPARSARFNQHQWHVLQRALLLKRDDRKISIRELLVGLGCEQAPLPLASPATLLVKRTDRPPWLQPALLAAVSLLVVGLVAYVFAPSLLGKSLQLGGATSLTEKAAAGQPHTTIAGADSPVESVKSTHALTTAAPDDALPAVSSIDSTSPAIGAATTSSGTAISTVSIQMPDIPSALNTKEAIATTRAESVAFSRDSFMASEGEGAASAVIRRSGRIDTALRVRWSLIGDSATPGEDYADIGSAIAEIPAGEREYILMIPLAADAVRENTELFTVKLDRADDGPPLLEPSTATVIVVDDD